MEAVVWADLAAQSNGHGKKDYAGNGCLGVRGAHPGELDAADGRLGVRAEYHRADLHAARGLLVPRGRGGRGHGRT